MKISTLIFLSIIFILLLFSVSTYTNFKQSEIVTENANYLSNSTDIIRQANRFQRNVLYMERGLRGYMMSGENYFLASYDSAEADNTTIEKELFGLVKDNTVQLKNLHEIRKIYSQWRGKVTETIRVAKREADSLASNSIIAGKVYNLTDEEQVNDQFEQKFSELRNTEYTTREKRRSALERSEYRTRVISFVLTGMSIVTGLVIAVLLARYISRQILKMVSLAKNIAEGNNNVRIANTAKNEFGQLTNSLNKMSETLEKNISLLQQKNKELDQFSYVVAHDLKAPLHGMDTLLTWIFEEHQHETPEKVLEYLRLVKERVNKSEQLIEGILTYARVGKEMLPKEDVDVDALVRDILQNVSLKPGLSILIENQLPVVYSQKVPLMQVFNNLITNAIKYNDKDLGTIIIGSTDKGDQYEFFVQDNGPGIPAELHNKIFGIFQTAKNTTSYESTGIGLAIVKKVLDERNETINIISEPGNGATFRFTWSKQ